MPDLAAHGSNFSSTADAAAQHRGGGEQRPDHQPGQNPNQCRRLAGLAAAAAAEAAGGRGSRYRHPEARHSHLAEAAASSPLQLGQPGDTDASGGAADSSDGAGTVDSGDGPEAAVGGADPAETAGTSTSEWEDADDVAEDGGGADADADADADVSAWLRATVQQPMDGSGSGKTSSSGSGSHRRPASAAKVPAGWQQDQR